MNKTLETVAVVHRLIIIVALSLFVVGISAHRENSLYDDAMIELDGIENGIRAASGQMNDDYKVIYDKSELKTSILAWLRKRNTEQQTIGVEVINPNDYTIPDPDRNRLVTLEAQVKWADRVYRSLDSPFFLCTVERHQVFHALNKLFNNVKKSKLDRIRVYVFRAKENLAESQQFHCKVELQFEVQIEAIIGLRTATLDIPSTVVNVTQLENHGLEWIDLEIAGSLVSG